ncbi:haloacid dehalogenase, type II [Aspergillus saccharolyticus JOP 1030-1]|uniref:HAD-like protein n=1 Tax=Aspergillus saccharolyticus JOP 1030-1 TaxID=1450539 RepID=A0A319A201_9EURO|nr:HAD-like protein [Aspergillus saccharolyticus JOP 1030-1]PYH41522.1 HAD-like protein [Aspergillus saccharolyticus JOP 1030-1]
MKEIFIAFDIYGTLLSFDAATEELAQYLGAERARDIAQLWRRYQLEYTWRLNSMDKYIPFNTITTSSLHAALTTTVTTLTPSQTTAVLAAYDRLQPFPDVSEALDRLTHTPTLTPLVFSNGTVEMIKACISHVHDAVSSLQTMEITSVDDEGVKRYKPAPVAYGYLKERVNSLARSKASSGDTGTDTGTGTGTHEIWLISANPFDITGAASAGGIKTLWVDREKTGWTDRAVPDIQPTRVVHQLKECVDVILDYYRQE